MVTDEHGYRESTREGDVQVNEANKVGVFPPEALYMKCQPDSIISYPIFIV